MSKIICVLALMACSFSVHSMTFQVINNGNVSGYDALQVWDIKDYDKGEVVSSCGIDDITEDCVCLGGDL